MTPLQHVLARIDRVCEGVGRDPSEVTLIAVSKTHSADKIRHLYDQGHRHFGESRLQEAQPKIETLPSDIVWHFVGHLQTNKAKKIAQLFDVIHTFRNEEQLRETAKAGRTVDGLIEINIAEEPQKSGISKGDLDELAQKCLHFPHVRLRGLMTVGPIRNDGEEMRPFFKELRLLNKRIGGEWLSMGMSADYEVAVQEGSTHVRVGTALFGDR